MLSTRKVLSPIGPRSSLDILSSAARACINLALYPSKRDELLGALNSSLINAPILGIPMTLALYEELSSPLFSKHKFEPKEFIDATKYVLEEYHNVEGNLQNEIMDESLEKWIKHFESKKSDDEKDANSSDSKFDLSISRKRYHVNALILEENAEWILNTFSPDNDLDLKKKAEENPDSLAARFMKMVTPDLFTNWYISTMNNVPTTILDYGGTRVICSRVSNVALLSARAQIIPPSPVSREQETELNEHDAQKNDDILNNIYSDIDEYPVAAQVEVLYDMIVERTANPRQDNDDENNDTISTSVVGVAVFEGWLHGAPDGSPLRWELARFRSPWEFR